MIDKRKDLPCAVVRDLLPLYHDGVVSSDTSDLIETHLEGCENCRYELNSIRSDEKIEGNLIEQDKDFYFKEFRDGVRTLRRNGTIRGVLIALAVVAVFVGGLQFLNTADIIKVDPADLNIDDVCRYDLGTDGGEGLFFTYQMNWDGGFSITFEDTSDPKEINIAIKRTALGGKMESDSRNPRSYWILDGFYKESADLSKAETVKVNGQIIWTKNQGINNKPLEYIGKLVRYEQQYGVGDFVRPEEKIISARIEADAISVTYEDLHGIKWDKDGNVIARFTVDENENIISMESVPSNEKGN